jgi:hypothetical protein
LEESATLRGQFQDLADLVDPGFGALTDAARTTIRQQQESEAGDLRSQFSRRDLGGSQFEINEQRRLALDFAIEEEKAVSEALIAEIELEEGILNDIAGLLELDAVTLQNEAELLAVELGLGELAGTGCCYAPKRSGTFSG